VSASIEVAQKATEVIEQVLSEMFDGDYANNGIILGTILNGSEEIQVQLKVTRDPCEFMDEQ